MTKDEALKLAMDWYGSGNQDPDEFERLILSIVAQPEQDGKCKYCTDGCPACDVRKLSEQERFALKHRIAELEGAVIGLQAQRTWVGLTGEEIEASKPTRSNDAVVWELAVEWAEAKLKEKNT
jgi:uncharacterized membrane protein